MTRRESASDVQWVQFNSHVYGRGAFDMKGSLAASIIAAESFIAVCPDYAVAIEIPGMADVADAMGAAGN